MAGMPKRRARRNPSQPRDPRTGQFVSRRNPSGIRDMTPYDKEFLALYQALPAQAPGLAGHGIYMGIDRFADAVMEKGYATADDVRQLKRRIANLKQAKENPSYDLPPHLHRVDGAGGRTVIVVEEEYEGEPDYVVLVYLPRVPGGINWDAHGSLRGAKRIADRVARQKKL